MKRGISMKNRTTDTSGSLSSMVKYRCFPLNRVSGQPSYLWEYASHSLSPLFSVCPLQYLENYPDYDREAPLSMRSTQPMI